jgi:hypothetical protein
MSLSDIGLPCTELGLERVPSESGEAVHVHKCSLAFARWKGQPLQDDYGGKTIVDVNGEPLFAELAIVRPSHPSDMDGRVGRYLPT